MRSVLIYLTHATEPEVADWLQQRYPLQQGPPWIAERVGDAVLYIDIYRDLDTEFEVETYFSLLECLGAEPTLSIIADVSGRHPGDTEVYELVCSALSAFEGVAQDEYTDHCWSLEEIEQAQQREGHPFFDYRGWYESEGITDKRGAGEK